MSKRLVIVGAGGFGRGVVDIVDAINTTSNSDLWDLQGIYDDTPSVENLARLQTLDVPYLGKVPCQSPSDKTWYVVGINNSRVRESISTNLDALGWTPASLIHPDSSIESRVPIGSGAIVRAGVRVATNTVIGQHVHLNFNVVVGHDVELGDFVSVNPLASIAGEVRIGRRSIIGTNAAILQGKSIGQDCTIGASACVTKSTGSGHTVVGVPAKVVL